MPSHFRCPTCRLTCSCLAAHQDCEGRRLQYGHHSHVLGVTPPLRLARLALRSRSFPGE